MSLWNSNDISDFSWLELQCKCGCERADMSGEFMAQLQSIRDVVGPMVVSSGFRCPLYNARVSRTGSDGPHTSGRAADIRVRGGKAYRLIEVAQAHGMTGLGISQKGPHPQRFVHLDNLQNGETPAPRPWVWSY